MKKTIITLASTFVAAGLVKALPHSYLDVGDNFKVGDQPFNEKPDNRNNYKVLVIATKMRKGQSRVLLTKPAAKPAQEAVQDSAKEAAQVSRAKDKGFEFIRGKSKVDELSHEAANREAFEEAHVYGKPDIENKITVSHFHETKKAKENLDVHIVKIPNKMKHQADKEGRTSIWVKPQSVEKLVKRPEHMDAWNRLQHVVTADHGYEPPKRKIKVPKRKQFSHKL